MTDIEWRPVEGFVAYEVSNDGRVRFIGGVRKFGSQRRYAPPKERTLQPHSGGYLQLILRQEGQRKAYNCYVHMLVARAFINNPDNLPEINHKDGNKSNNCVWNLEWTTRRDNIIHSYRVLKRNHSSRMGRKISRAEFDAIKASSGSLTSVAREFDVSIARVSRIRKGLCAAFY